MFKKRNKWVPVYSRHIFQADMMTTERIEIMNSFFEGYMNESLSLNEVLKQFGEALACRREEEIKEDIQSEQTRPVLKLGVPMELQAADVYTGSLFKKFHYEFCESFNYIAEETGRVGMDWTYAVSRWGQNRSRLVNLNSYDNNIRAFCDCQNYEFMGILCRHIFKVFTVRNIMLIPDKYFLRRWTKKAKVGVVLCHSSKEQADHQNSLALRYNDLSHLSINYCAKASVSTDAYLTAKHEMEIILRELEKVAEEDMTITHPDIEDIRSSHFPVEVNNLGTSNLLMCEDNQTFPSATHVPMPNPPGISDKRTGFWLRL
ncbi:hypothetical protein AQUCO_11000019v1 [Aquilegia coerulea]|uniref:Protein FAR1-RELATED SEQUENCE n=1 Tax=Aquilegia coerulea TaxID=218851 RepID=A0A2G5C2U6_AQUCA|nr:hypothetical protein AQUCO_11000019v1 [Aquilegia coerulea]